MKNRQAYLPLFLSLALGLGMYLGMRFNYTLTPEARSTNNSKLDQVMELINQAYVDEVDPDSVLDLTLSELMHRLDPHSAYIPLSDVAGVEEDIRGEFQGIGVEFIHLEDTLALVNILPDGPSERAGLLAGDRIVRVDSKKVAARGLSTEELVALLKGPMGTKVKVTVVGPSRTSPTEVSITRGPIPLASTDMAVIPQENAGYLRINRFSETTSSEVREALMEFKRRQCGALILDLRDNPGGLLTAAVQVADEFLPAGAVVVKIKGRGQEEEERTATSRGIWKTEPVVVLINEGSASAAEIVAGALQDHKRAKLVGNRSFGKGLVQQEIGLQDGSRLRLTTSRYYTPNGRSIQRPYEDGYEAYQEATAARWSGSDSLNHKRIEGGIEPDVAVALDSLSESLWFYHFFNWGLMDQHAFRIADRMRKTWNQKDPEDFIESWELPENALAAYLQEIHSKAKPGQMDTNSRKKLELRFRALVAKNLFGDAGFFPIYLQDDPFYATALEQLQARK